jgi:DNA-binding MarR family transcriptional regulator
LFKLHAAPQQYKLLTIYVCGYTLIVDQYQNIKMDEELQVFEQVAHYFGLLSDPTRLRILSCLCAEERPVRDVVEKIGLTQANISRHLNILFGAVYYRVIDPNFVDICRAVSVTVASRDMGEAFGIPVDK